MRSRPPCIPGPNSNRACLDIIDILLPLPRMRPVALAYLPAMHAYLSSLEAETVYISMPARKSDITRVEPFEWLSSGVEDDSPRGVRRKQMPASHDHIPMGTISAVLPGGGGTSVLLFARIIASATATSTWSFEWNGLFKHVRLILRPSFGHYAIF